ALAVTADVIVTGISVPGPFDGVELVRRLRANEPTRHKPILVLTASAFAPAERRADAAGCDAFLPKPCYPDKLLAEIRRVLATATRPATPARPISAKEKREIAG